MLCCDCTDAAEPLCGDFAGLRFDPSLGKVLRSRLASESKLAVLSTEDSLSIPLPGSAAVPDKPEPCLATWCTLVRMRLELRGPALLRLCASAAVLGDQVPAADDVEAVEAVESKLDVRSRGDAISALESAVFALE